MEATEIKSKIKEIVAGMFDLQIENIPDEKPFPQMAKYDSMRALEFLAKLENEFGVLIDPDLLQKMGTVESSTQMIQELMNAK
ncbi:MAG TPA: acyl carrier protein [bacterium]|jgi:acyl carrier protein|nr:acyl carrier protein [bacterium]